MNIKKTITGIFASALMACSLSAFNVNAVYDYFPIKVMKGDINGDGEINLRDYLLLNGAIKGKQGFKTMNAYNAADVNWDGEVNVTDIAVFSDHINFRKAIKSGDLDGDCVVTIFDRNTIKNYVSGKVKLTKAELLASDLDNNGKVNSYDVLLMNYYLDK